MVSTEQILDLFYPRKCGLCSLEGLAICAACDAEFVELSSPVVLEGVRNVAAIYEYEGRAAQAVKRLKYERVTSLAVTMSARMAGKYLNLPEPDLIVPVPIHWMRFMHRGFNQSTLLCDHLPPALVQPQFLKRIRPTKQQVGLSVDERSRNLKGAFEASAEVAGAAVLLVDDVCTSGHTARECAQELIRAGAKCVDLLVFASGSDR